MIDTVLTVLHLVGALALFGWMWCVNRELKEAEENFESIAYDLNTIDYRASVLIQEVADLKEKVSTNEVVN